VVVVDKHQPVREALDQLSKVIIAIISNRIISEEVNQQLNSNNLGKIIEVVEATEGVDKEMVSVLLRETIIIIIIITIVEEAETKAIDKQILRLIKLLVSSRCSPLALDRPSGVTNSNHRALQTNQGVEVAASSSNSNTKTKAPNSLQVYLVLLLMAVSKMQVAPLEHKLKVLPLLEPMHLIKDYNRLHHWPHNNPVVSSAVEWETRANSSKM